MGRWTLNGNADMLGDEAEYVKALDLWKPPGQVLMNGLNGKSQNNIVVRLATFIRRWGGNTVYRPYEKGNAEKTFWKNRTPEEHLAFIQSHNAPEWLWFQIGNEPTLVTEKDMRDMSKWLATFIRLCVVAGIRAVVYNPAVGSFQRWQIEAGWFDELLIALSENAHRIVDGWPQFILGSHSTAYWMGIAAWHCAGRNPADLIHPERLKKEHWPTKEQVFDADTGDNWILFRDIWFVERARMLRPSAPDIRIAATEAGPEDLPNIREQFPAVAKKMDEVCGRQWRGIRTAEKYYEWVFPHQSAAESICDDMAFVERIAPEIYLFFAGFSWTFHNAHPEYWRRDYNWGEMPGVLQGWGKRVALPKPPGAEDLPPPAHDPGYLNRIAQTKGMSVNVYQFSNLDAPVVAKIESGDEIGVNASVVRDDLIAVRVGGKVGFASTKTLWFVENNKPEQPPAQDYAAAAQKHIEANRRSIEQLKRVIIADDEEIMELQKAMAELQEKVADRIKSRGNLAESIAVAEQTNAWLTATFVQQSKEAVV